MNVGININKTMKNIFKVLVVIAIFMVSCNSNREFEDAADFKKWIENKSFESLGNDQTQMDIKGNLHSPVGTLELKFKDGKLVCQSCSPQAYEVYYDAGKWVVGFNKCGDGDLFELVVPETGDCYVRSIDYDTSKMEEMAGSGINKLDAIVSKHSVDGPIMNIR
jgi:hypothetical protein